MNDDRAGVALAVLGVQQAIVESRTTADLNATSEMRSLVAAAAARVLQAHGQLRIPDIVGNGAVPNRLNALVDASIASRVAQEAADGARGAWTHQLAALMDTAPASRDALHRDGPGSVRNRVHEAPMQQLLHDPRACEAGTSAAASR